MKLKFVKWEDEMISTWVVYDRIQIKPICEFTGSLADAENKYPGYVIRHKIYS
jgi:hypothetical protein